MTATRCNIEPEYRDSSNPNYILIAGLFFAAYSVLAVVLVRVSFIAIDWLNAFTSGWLLGN